MSTLKITFLLFLASFTSLLEADEEEAPITLEKAKELGRTKSRFLQEIKAEHKTTAAVPEADLAYFEESLRPVLNNSCVACHGPKKSKAGLRIDQLSPDLLAGPDVERWTS